MSEHNKFILIEVVEQDIHRPQFFSTQEEATHEMLNRLKKVKNLSDSDLAQAELVEGSFGGLMTIDWDVFFSNTQARCEKYGQNYDWKVIDLTENSDE